MIQFSDVTGKQYDDEDCVFFRNIYQSSKYISWGAKVVDLFCGSDDKLVFVFSKQDHEKYKHKWGSSNKNGGDLK